jgi:hypothetical protein
VAVCSLGPKAWAQESQRQGGRASSALNFSSRELRTNCLCYSSASDLWDPRLFTTMLVLFCFGGTGVLTEGLTLARQRLYYLNHASSPFYFSYFSNGVLCFCQDNPGQQSSYLCISHSWVCAKFSLLVEMEFHFLPIELQ